MAKSESWIDGMPKWVATSATRLAMSITRTFARGCAAEVTGVFQSRFGQRELDFVVVVFPSVHPGRFTGNGCRDCRGSDGRRAYTQRLLATSPSLLPGENPVATKLPYGWAKKTR